LGLLAIQLTLPLTISAKKANSAHHKFRDRALAPSAELLNDWKKGLISWQEYEKRYLQEMSAQQGKIRELAKRAESETITLLCFEPEDNPHCHRHLLKGLIESCKRP